MANIPSEYEYIENLGQFWLDYDRSLPSIDIVTENWSNFWAYISWVTYKPLIMSNPINEISFAGGFKVGNNFNFRNFHIDHEEYHQDANYYEYVDCTPCTFLTINVTSGENEITVDYGTPSFINLFPEINSGGSTISFRISRDLNYDGFIRVTPLSASSLNWRTSFGTLSECIDYIYSNFCNVTLYVDGDLWVKGGVTSYTWQSVPSISGKNGILKLVKLASDAINDGDPVSNASINAFDILPSSNNNIRSLVNLTLEPIPINNAVTITYTIPALKDDSYSSVKIYAKIGEVPKCDETDDIVEDIDPTINEISLENLEYETEYFFCIQSISNNGLKLSSNVESITTDELEGTTFDFTGNEQTFVVPETGMYSLETWGAQGQSDENNRGGYGAYAYAEAFLTQGQTLYINVGGQNGYNGGGNYQHGTIRNILIPDSGQSFIIDERCWAQTGTTPSAVYPDSTLTCFALGSDMGKIRNEIGRDNYVVLWERNGIKCYVGITRTNASYGEPKFCCAIYNEKNERVLGSLDIRSTYSQEFGPYCGFDAATEDWYNSNVRARLYHWGLAYGVDDTNHLGYVVHCYGQHRGYYENTNLYLPQASYDSSYYGWNAAKLYDALIRASQ